MDKMNELVVSKYLGDFLENLWSKQRLEVDRVLERLQTKHSSEGKSELRNAIAGWIRFFEFLQSECSGSNFDNDKQWSELLDLMEISRKLNHRSVKVKDFIRNRDLIEANSNSIRRLNQSAKLLRTIDWSSNELDKLLQGCKLELPPATRKQNEETDDDEAGDLMSVQLTLAVSYLRNRCLSVLYVTKLELSDSSIEGDSRIPVWRAKLEKQELAITKLVDFVESLGQLKLKLQQLKALIGSDGNKLAERENNKINNSIADCKRKFNRVYQFSESLQESLYKYVDKKTNNWVVSLMKLFDPRRKELVEDMYSRGLSQAILDLNECQSRLNEIMQTLRLEFGRFYFLSDAELLRIISLNLNLVLVEKEPENERLLGKLFNNSLNSILLDSDRKHIIAVKSPVGETIYFSNEDIVILRKKINLYSVEIVRVLNDLLRKLSKTLKRLTLESLNGNKLDSQIDWPLPIQLMNITEYVKFVAKVEASLEGKLLKSLIEFYETRFKNLSSANFEQDSGDFKKSAMISLTVHFISVLIDLQEQKVDKINDWKWQRQVRYYREGEDILVRIADAIFVYRFDFLPVELNELASSSEGTNNKRKTYKRLVNTRITNRCFLVCSHSNYKLKLGANPHGPAGSGKTETVKALGHLLGCQVIVHNCDESNDSDSLDRLIWGLAHTGLWGCFDEFNRLKLSVLSTVSATLELVQSSLRENKATVESLSSEGQMMRIDPSSAFFVTLNPAGGTGSKAYRGRRRLPANIRNLFVPISMTRVEVGSIVCDYLMGFSGELHLTDQFNSALAVELAHKLELCLDKMNSRLGDCGNRCEWDLRLVIAILRRFKMSLIGRKSSIESIKDKFVNAVSMEVSPRLSGSGEIESFEHGLEECFETKLSTRETLYPLGGEFAPEVAKLVSQLHQQLKIRSGVILLGPSKAGKSHTWRLLAEKLAESVKWFSINPKCCKKNELFGYVDVVSQKWVDGVLTERARDGLHLLQKSNKLQQVWIILDGPIDPDWIETLNSVLDDNQVLTLSSGERIAFTLGPSGKSIKLIMETNSIRFASPATISRLGLINFEASSAAHDDFSLEGFFSGTAGSKKVLLVESDEKIMSYLRQIPVSRYACNSITDCDDLLDLIKRLEPKSLVVFDNVDSIDPDNWSARSFVELLRYITTYETYNDPKSLSSIPISQMRFVISTNQMDRLLSQERLSIVAAEVLGGSKDLDKIETTEDAIGVVEEFLTRNKNQIITLSSKRRGGDRRRKIKDSCEDSYQVLEFRSPTMTEQSIEVLERSLQEVVATKVQRKLFLINQLEMSFMAIEMKRKLCHNLNLLKLTCNQYMKVIHLVHQDELKAGEMKFWSKMGPVYEESLKTASTLYDEEGPLDLTKEELRWMNERVEVLIEREEIDLNDWRRFVCFKELFCNFYLKSQSSFASQKRTIQNGLKQLEDFERNVQGIREECDREGSYLNGQKRIIEELIDQIDESLAKSSRQKAKIESLKEKQKVKMNELNGKKNQIELELSKVRPLVEQSKTQIDQHLKPEALNEIKTLRSPPKTIKDILEVLFVLLRQEDSSWTAMKAFLTKRSLRDELTNYDIERNLANEEDLLRKIEIEIQAKGDSFNELQAARASKAIVPIVNWIRATLAYGKAVSRLAPLSKESRVLETEAERLAEQAQSIETEAQEVDQRMAKLGNKLQQLELEYEASKQKNSKIKGQLAKAQKVRLELEKQIGRWQEDLNSIEKLLNPTGSRLLKSCLSLCSISVYGFNCGHNLIEILQRRLEIFELPIKVDQFISESLMVLQSTFNDSLSGISGEIKSFFRSDELSRILQLICLKLLLSFSKDLVTFVNVGGDRVTKEELVQYLSLKSIAFEPVDISIIKYESSSFDAANFQRFQQSFDLAVKLNRLVVLQVAGNDWDILNLVCKKMQTYRRILLVGDLKLQGSLMSFLNVVNFLASYETMPEEDIQATITNKWIKLSNPELDSKIEQLEVEFCGKQAEIKALEKSLLGKLAAGFGNSPEGSMNEALVSNLGELQESSGRLEGDVKLLLGRLGELEQKKEEYAGFASKAAKYFKQNLAHLNKIDSFYHMPLNSYINLLSKQQKQPIDFKLVSEEVELPMRPEHKRSFQKRLSQWEIPCFRNQLGDVLEKYLSNSNQLGLMIVLHESTKSSPQLELDELLGCKGKQKHKQQVDSYAKVYATGESADKRLEVALTSLLSSPGEPSAIKLQPVASSTEATSTRCLCIANAHLATDWINRRLLQRLSEAPVGAPKRFLVVLIAEAAVVSGDGAQFSPEVLDFASVKFWYEELSSSMLDRFRLIERRALTNSPQGQEEEEEEESKDELMSQLALLHVVCQEKTKELQEPSEAGGRASLARWSYSGYNFDYDLFCLARKMLESLRESGRGQEDIRETFAHYLESVIYGSRMETTEDERSLSELIWTKFIGNQERAGRELERFLSSGGSLL